MNGAPLWSGNNAAYDRLLVPESTGDDGQAQRKSEFKLSDDYGTVPWGLHIATRPLSWPCTWSLSQASSRSLSRTGTQLIRAQHQMLAPQRV